MRRVGIAGLWQETNTYSSRTTSLQHFAEFELLTGEAIVGEHRNTGSVIGGMLDAPSFEFVPIFSAGAWPAGPADRRTLSDLWERFETALREAGPLDGLLLNLHGAMVCEGVDDVEHETVRLARSVIGEVPIAAVLDLHGNPSTEMVASCDIVISYDTYPHVDMYERGREAATLLNESLRGPPLRTWVGKVPLLTCPIAQGTSDQPMADLQDLAERLAQKANIRRVCLLPGFPYSDVARAGFSVLATGLDSQEADARQVIARMCAEVEARIDEFLVTRPSPAEAVSRALSIDEGPIVLADVADNIGGGGPGDGTSLLSELMSQGADRAIVLITDQEVAMAAARIGPGGNISCEVGAKSDDRHGKPVPISGRILRVTDGAYQSGGTWMTGRRFTMGTTAVIAVDGLEIVVMERATPPFHSEQLTSVGIDPSTAAIIAVKGAIAWRAAYGSVAAGHIEVDTPGVCPVNPHALPRTTVPMRTY